MVCVAVKIMYSHERCNDVSVNNRLHIQWWSHKIIMELNFLYEMEGFVVQEEVVFCDGSSICETW